jgi:hypothetical protein
MKKELNYLASNRWEKVGRQELRSTPYKQEINPRWAANDTPIQTSAQDLKAKKKFFLLSF